MLLYALKHLLSIFFYVKIKEERYCINFFLIDGFLVIGCIERLGKYYPVSVTLKTLELGKGKKFFSIKNFIFLIQILIILYFELSVYFLYVLFFLLKVIVTTNKENFLEFNNRFYSELDKNLYKFVIGPSKNFTMLTFWLKEKVIQQHFARGKCAMGARLTVNQVIYSE